MSLLTSPSALVIAPALVVLIREIGAIVRQHGAVRGLERIAEHHPDTATLLAAVIDATSTHAMRKSRRHGL